MVKRYPHTAIIKYSPISFDEDKGFPVKGAEQTKEIECRANPGGNAYIITEDGNRIKFKYTVKCSLFDDEIPLNAKLVLFGSEYKILQLHKYQTHIKIWV